MFSNSDYILDDGYQGRLEKSSVMVNKVIGKQKHRSLLLHSNKTAPKHDIMLMRKQNTHENIPHERKAPLKKAKGVIYSEKHLDTPILSHAFNLHSKTKYIHEPLMLTDYDGLSSAKKAELLRNILKCNFQTLYTTGRKRWNGVLDFTDKGTTYQYEKVFCFLGSKTEMDCPTKVEHLEQLCHMKLHRIVKLAAVKYIKHLDELLEDGTHIMHVVRDPRTIMAAKLEESPDKTEKHLTDIQIYCNEIERDMSYITNHFVEYRDVNKTLYKLVRYEDIEKSPTDEMKELFLYLSIDLQDVGVNLLNYYKTGFQETMNDVKFPWKGLTVPIIQRIQEDCDRSMGMLGYSKIRELDRFDQVDPQDLLSPLFELKYLS